MPSTPGAMKRCPVRTTAGADVECAMPARAMVRQVDLNADEGVGAIKQVGLPANGRPALGANGGVRNGGGHRRGHHGVVSAIAEAAASCVENKPSEVSSALNASKPSRPRDRMNPTQKRPSYTDRIAVVDEIVLEGIARVLKLDRAKGLQFGAGMD
jgi:hypothetical protein